MVMYIIGTTSKIINMFFDVHLNWNSLYEMALYMDSQNRDWEEFQQHLDEQTNLLDILDRFFDILEKFPLLPPSWQGWAENIELRKERNKLWDQWTKRWDELRQQSGKWPDGGGGIDLPGPDSGKWPDAPGPSDNRPGPGPGPQPGGKPYPKPGGGWIPPWDDEKYPPPPWPQPDSGPGWPWPEPRPGPSPQDEENQQKWPWIPPEDKMYPPPDQDERRQQQDLDNRDDMDIPPIPPGQGNKWPGECGERP